MNQLSAGLNRNPSIGSPACDQKTNRPPPPGWMRQWTSITALLHKQVPNRPEMAWDALVAHDPISTFSNMATPGIGPRSRRYHWATDPDILYLKHTYKPQQEKHVLEFWLEKNIYNRLTVVIQDLISTKCNCFILVPYLKLNMIFSYFCLLLSTVLWKTGQVAVHYIHLN